VLKVVSLTALYMAQTRPLIPTSIHPATNRRDRFSVLMPSETISATAAEPGYAGCGRQDARQAEGFSQKVTAKS
jgi:hypothetical protein